MKRKTAKRKTEVTPASAKTNLSTATIGTTVSIPTAVRRKRAADGRKLRSALEVELGMQDPLPRPPAAWDDIKFLEQVTLGRWLEFPMPAEVQDAIQRLAEFISKRASHSHFGDSPTAEQLQSLRVALEISYRRGFYLALLRYENDLKIVPEAAAMLEGLRQAARKGGAARRAKAEPTHKAIRKRFRELRKTTPKKTVRYLRVAEEFGISDRHVARIVDGID